MCHLNQIAVLPIQALKEDHSEHRRLIPSATSPLEVKPHFQDLDMVRFSGPVHCWCRGSSLLLSPSVYYRVYSPAGGVEVKNPEFPDDPYLGRALAIRVTPPHTIASVKRHICGREDIANHKNTSLFDNILSRIPLDDSKPVHIFDHAEIGSTSGDPVALVMLEPGSTGYPYKLKANLDSKVNSRISGRVSHCEPPIG